MATENDGEGQIIGKLIIDNISFSYIERSPIHGFGLFAEADIREGTILGILDGQIIPWDHYEQIVARFKTIIGDSAPHLFMEWNALSKTTLMVRPFRTKYSFINHSRHPNLKIHRNPLSVVAYRAISKKDELLLDYRDEPLSDQYLQGHGRSFL